MDKDNLLLNYLYKYFFILHAAANGIIVKYVGGNQFEFIQSKNTNLSEIKSPDEFIKQFSQKIPKYILNQRHNSS